MGKIGCLKFARKYGSPKDAENPTKVKKQKKKRLVGNKI